jgi:hypothetical protein
VYKKLSRSYTKTFLALKMGRLNKKLQKSSAKSTVGNQGGRISKSDVLKTLARKDKLESDRTQQRVEKQSTLCKKPALPKVSLFGKAYSII